tara:strand:+ start:707 stop:1150 length:444 start_codon:yes stop_codon:yes gene_type:complete
MLELLQDKLVESMKAKDRFRSTTLRNIIAELKKLEKDSDKEISDNDRARTLQSLSKRYKQSIAQFSDGGREELAEAEREELTILEEFLPKQLSDEEIKNTISNIVSNIESPSMADFGKVMGEAMKTLKNNADGSVVQGIVKQMLGNS